MKRILVAALLSLTSLTAFPTSTTNTKPETLVVAPYDMAKGAPSDVSYPLLTLEQMIQKVDALGGPQKEFETDQAFTQRMSTLGPFTTCSAIVKPNIQFNSTTGEANLLYLLMGVPSWSDAKGQSDSLEQYPSSRIGQIATELGNSVGQNGYGAKVKITTYQLDNLYIVMNPVQRSLKGDSFSPRLIGKAKKALMDDIQAGKKVEMCFEAFPVTPYVGYSFGGKKPTLDDPSATIARTRNVRVAISRFYIKGEKPQADYVEDLRFSHR